MLMTAHCGRDHSKLDGACPECLSNLTIAPKIAPDRERDAKLISEREVRSDDCPYCHRALPVGFPGPPTKDCAA
jgi:hypothetical protein